MAKATINLSRVGNALRPDTNDHISFVNNVFIFFPSPCLDSSNINLILILFSYKEYKL